MIVTVYSTKGSAGKTPIATNIALERDYALGTNEPYHVFDSFIPEERLLTVEPDEAFPLIPKEIDIVFDLAGSIAKTANSIVSALRQSDLVIVPIYNEIKSLKSGIHTILEVGNFTQQIVVVATKLEKHRKEIFVDWKDSEDFKNIAQAVQSNIGFQVPIFPLKYSKVFDLIFEQEKSITEIMKHDPLASYTYRDVAKQFGQLLAYIDKNHAQQK